MMFRGPKTNPHTNGYTSKFIYLCLVQQFCIHNCGDVMYSILWLIINVLILN